MIAPFLRPFFMFLKEQRYPFLENLQINNDLILFAFFKYYPQVYDPFQKDAEHVLNEIKNVVKKEKTPGVRKARVLNLCAEFFEIEKRAPPTPYGFRSHPVLENLLPKAFDHLEKVIGSAEAITIFAKNGCKLEAQSRALCNYAVRHPKSFPDIHTIRARIEKTGLHNLLLKHLKAQGMPNAEAQEVLRKFDEKWGKKRGWEKRKGSPRRRGNKTF